MQEENIRKKETGGTRVHEDKNTAEGKREAPREKTIMKPRTWKHLRREKG